MWTFIQTFQPMVSGTQCTMDTVGPSVWTHSVANEHIFGHTIFGPSYYAHKMRVVLEDSTHRLGKHWVEINLRLFITLEMTSVWLLSVAWQCGALAELLRVSLSLAFAHIHSHPHRTRFGAHLLLWISPLNFHRMNSNECFFSAWFST